MTIANDGELVDKLTRADDFDSAVAMLQGWADEMVRAGSCIRVDEGIAREAFASVAQDYDLPGVARLVSVPHAIEPRGEVEVLAPVAAEHSVQAELALA